MDSILNILNISLIVFIIGFVFYFIDKKIINKKYHSAYKKAYQYVLLTLKEGDKERVLKNLKEYQKEVLENAQYILTDTQIQGKETLESRKASINNLLDKLGKDKAQIITQLDKINSEISNDDINKNYENLKLDLTNEIEALKELIKERENDVDSLKTKREIKNAGIKNVSFISTPVNTFSNRISKELENLTNLMPFYALIYVEFLISYDFFKDLFRDGSVLRTIIPFLLTAIILICIEYTIRNYKEKKELSAIILGTFISIVLFFIIYSRIFNLLGADASAEVLIVEIFKIVIFFGVILTNYILMDSYEIKSEELLFSPLRVIKIIFEFITNLILKISTTGATLASKTADFDKMSFEKHLKKKAEEIHKIKFELDEKINLRSSLNSKKDDEVNNRKKILGSEIDKRFIDINTQIQKAKTDLSNLESNLNKNFDKSDQIKNGSFDGTYYAVKKFYKIK
jgi:hypothetical protein